MRKLRKITAIVGGLAIASVGFASGAQAAGQHNGWGDLTNVDVVVVESEPTTTSTQGNSGKPKNLNASDSSQGTTTTTTTTTTTETNGPKGQLNKDEPSSPNVTSDVTDVTVEIDTDTTSSGPGNSQHDR